MEHCPNCIPCCTRHTNYLIRMVFQFRWLSVFIKRNFILIVSSMYFFYKQYLMYFVVSKS
jgi:hypothetical protein